MDFAQQHLGFGGDSGGAIQALVVRRGNFQLNEWRLTEMQGVFHTGSDV